MRRFLLSLAVLFILLSIRAASNVVWAHGGVYRPPAGEVPPGNRDPRDPQPPPEAGPPTDPPGGEGTRPPDDGGTPGSGGNAPPPPESPRPGSPSGAPPGIGPGAGGGVASGGRRGPAPKLGGDQWFTWWCYNKDEILNLRANRRKAARAVPEASSPFQFGPGEARGGAEAPSVRVVRERIAPALEALVANRDIHPDIRGGALIALARCRDTDHTPAFLDAARRRRGEDQMVVESAILALGISGMPAPEIRDFLIGVADDAEYPFRARCFAMISLGLLRDDRPKTMDCLRRRLDGRESQLDVKLCALVAMGLIGDPAIVPELTGWLASGRVGKEKLGPLELSWVVSALGRIGDPSALKDVVGALHHRSAFVRRSAMIAAGQLIVEAEPRAKSDTLNRLARAIEAESDGAAKNFGIIALGRVGGDPQASDEVRRACIALLTRHYEDGNEATVRPFAALALGLVGFGEDKPVEIRYALAEPIRKTLAEGRGDPVALGANALALGMLADRRGATVDLLAGILRNRGAERKLRGAAAIALGLIGDLSARAAVMDVLEEREDRDLRMDTAAAAGLLGDSDALDRLLGVLKDPKASQFVLGSVALAIGQIGDVRAVDPLLAIVEPGKKDGENSDVIRALATVALGQIAETDDIRVLFRISKDVNYRSSVPSLDEILTIL